MMQLKLAMTVRHFDEGLFVEGEGVSGVVAVFFLML